MPPIGVHFTTRQKQDPVNDVGLVRLWDNGVAWSQLCHAPGSYNFDLLDYLVFERYKGKNISYCVASTPSFYSQKPNEPHYAPWLGPGTNSLPKDPDHDYKPFLWELSQRYKGHINSYELYGNEPQLVDFLAKTHFNDKGLNYLADLIKIGARIIKSNDPKALIGSPALLPRESSGGAKKFGKILDAIQRRGADKSIDYWTTHIYPEPGKGRKRWTKYFNVVKDELKRRKLGGPIRITETMYGLLGDPIPDSKIYELIRDTYKHHPKNFIYWYAFDRPDLNGTGVGDGFQIDTDRVAWRAIKKYHDAF